MSANQTQSRLYVLYKSRIIPLGQLANKGKTRSDQSAYLSSLSILLVYVAHKCTVNLATRDRVIIFFRVVCTSPSGYEPGIYA